MGGRARVSKVPLDQLATCLAIRREVFVEGQRVAEDLEIDGLDPICTHFLAVLDGKPVGTARLRIADGKAKAERVAVLEPYRGESIGRALMQALEGEAAAHGLAAVVLNAQVPVIPFYERLGYRAEGDVFMEANIPHRTMRKNLGARE